MKSLREEMLLSDTLGNPKNQFSTLVEILQQRASSEPAQIAYTYLANGETPEDRLTYQQLDCKAKAIAAHLQSCIFPGDRALLIYPQGLEFIGAFFGCLYAGVIAIPAPAPEASRLKRIRPRLESIIQDAECSFILSTSKILSQLEPCIADYKNLKALSYIATNTINQNLKQDRKETPIKDDCQNLHLSSWRVAHTGAETIRQENLELFADKFKLYGFKLSAFYPSYGLAEATLMVTTKKPDESPKFCTVSQQSLSQGRVVIEKKIKRKILSA